MVNLARILVIKRNGVEERFSVEKLRKSLLKALKYAGLDHKLDEIIEEVVNDISSYIRKSVNLRIKASVISEIIEKVLISKIIENPSFEKSARAYVLARIYNQVFGKGKWKYFDEDDIGFTYAALRVLTLGTYGKIQKAVEYWRHLKCLCGG